jgi:D-alanine-D-alanine ligase
MKTPIAVFAGGYSGEAAVSLKSAAMVMNNIDRDAYDPVLITVSKSGWTAHYGDQEVNVDKGTLTIELPNQTFKPELAFIMIHGTPGENGILQGYLETIGVPYTTGNVLNMALTFDKGLTTQTLRALALPTTQGVLLRNGQAYSADELIAELGLPCFVKPNRGGSSIGMSKVSRAEDLPAALDLAFKEDSQVIVERFIHGTEVTCGVIPFKGDVRALPATEIVSENAFFDFEAKYLGKSQEITPARISHAMMERVQSLAVNIYRLLECGGMIRVDMIITEEGPFVIEVNTVPGFTEASIIPQQAAAVGISKTQLISTVIDECLKKSRTNQKAQ